MKDETVYDAVMELMKSPVWCGGTTTVPVLGQIAPYKFGDITYGGDRLPWFDGWTFGNIALHSEEIRNIYSNKKAGITIVIFNDDTKMEFKLSKGDKYDIDKVILMALTKKRNELKTNSSYRKFMDKQRKLVTEIKTNKRPKKKIE